jgi:hypothetical protein
MVLACKVLYKKRQRSKVHLGLLTRAQAVVGCGPLQAVAGNCGDGLGDILCVSTSG